MPALIQSRRLRVFIGSDQQDWSASAGEFLPQWDSLSESGLVTVSATLQIIKVSTNPESIDPRINPARWRPGQPVRVEVTNSAGTYVVHPMGRLFILEEPDFPDPEAGIELQLGCRLAWHNTFEYDDEKTGITLGTSINSASAVRNLLLANEVPDGNISVSSWPYGLTVPDGKGPGGSFIQQAGELAYSNNYRYLYQNTSGTIVAGALDLSIGGPTVTVTLGSNDVAYQSVKVEGSPPDQIKVAGTGTVTTSVKYPIVDVVNIEGDSNGYKYWFTFAGNRQVTACALGGGQRRIGKITTKINKETNGSQVSIVTTIYEDAIRTGVSKGLLNTNYAPCGLDTWKITKRTQTYNQSKGGRLEEEIEEVKQRRFSYFDIESSFYGGGFYNIMDTVSRVTTTYTYASGEVIEKIERVEEQLQYLIDESTTGGDPPYIYPDTSLTEVKREIETWEKTGKNTYKKSRVEKYPRKFKDNAPESAGAPIASGTTTTTSTGENQPPRAELWDGGIITEDVEYQATANYTQPGGSTGRTRKRLFTLPYGFSQSQCQAMALLQIKLIAGRHRAVAVEMPVTDALLSAPPLFAFNIVHPDGAIYHYRADGVTWEHTADTCKVACSGILVGSTPAPTQQNPAPDPEPVTGTEVVANSIPVEANGLQVYATI